MSKCRVQRWLLLCWEEHQGATYTVSSWGLYRCALLQEVMSVEEESTSCYCLMDSTSCHLLLDQPGSYALVGEPLTQAAVKRLKLAVFGSVEAGSMSYSLRVYCVGWHATRLSGNGGRTLDVRLIVFFFCLSIKGWVMIISSSTVFSQFSTVSFIPKEDVSSGLKE